MSENKPEIKKGPESIGKRLISIGERIDELSNQEVKNRKIILGLAIAGLAGLGAMAGHFVEGSDMMKHGDELIKMSEAAERAELWGTAYNLSGAAGDAYSQAAKEYQVVVGQSVFMCSQLGVIIVGESVKYFTTGEGIYYLEGKTKVSTSAGPALAHIFKTCGEYFEKHGST